MNSFSFRYSLVFVPFCVWHSSKLRNVEAAFIQSSGVDLRLPVYLRLKNVITEITPSIDQRLRSFDSKRRISR